MGPNIFGNARTLTPAGKTLENYDLVITTFQTLASEHKAYEVAGQAQSDDEFDSDGELIQKTKAKKKAKAPQTAIYSVKWFRVVIGETSWMNDLSADAHS